MTAITTEAPNAFPAPEAGVSIMLDLAQIDLTSANPRRTRDETRFAELVANVRQLGVLQPILVRPNPSDATRYIVVAGERRTRAALEAGLKQIPAVVRQLDEKEALAVAVFENLHREDIHPIEEAEAFERLIAAYQWTAEQVGERIGKSKAYVYGRLKLTALGEKGRQAFYEGRLDASTALLIARIPGEQLQSQSLAKLLQRNNGHPTYREAVDFIHRECMVRLSDAPFKLTEATWPSQVGSCKACPKRSGNAPELFHDVDGANVCTDPACYREKVAAHNQRTMDAASARGERVIAGEEAKRLYPHGPHYGTPKGFMRPDVTTDLGGGKWGKPSEVLKGDDRPKATLVHIDGRLIELWPTQDVRAKLIESGAIRKEDKGPASASEKEREERAARNEDAVRAEVQAREAQADAIKQRQAALAEQRDARHQRYLAESAQRLQEMQRGDWR